MRNYTRNEWERCIITLELNLVHSFLRRVGFLLKSIFLTHGIVKLDVEIWKLTVVLDYYEAMETYSRIGLLRSYGNLQSYWTTTKLRKLTVVLDYYSPI